MNFDCEAEEQQLTALSPITKEMNLRESPEMLAFSFSTSQKEMSIYIIGM